MRVRKSALTYPQEKMISKRLLLVFSLLLMVVQWTMAWNESAFNRNIYAEIGPETEAEIEIESERDGPTFDRWLLGYAAHVNNGQFDLFDWTLILGPRNGSAHFPNTFKRYLQFHNLKLDC